MSIKLNNKTITNINTKTGFNFLSGDSIMDKMLICICQRHANV